MIKITITITKGKCNYSGIQESGVRIQNGLRIGRTSTEEFFTPASLKFAKGTKKRKTDPVKMWRYFVFWQVPGRSCCANPCSRQNKKSRHGSLKSSRRKDVDRQSYPSFSQGKSEAPVVTGVSPVPPTRRLLQKRENMGEERSACSNRRLAGMREEGII